MKYKVPSFSFKQTKTRFVFVTILFFLFFGFTTHTQAATNIYYSVGQNTTDHKTGTPTITIVSGVATFSVAQTATNMGVGDKVTFNTSSVCYISGKQTTSIWNLITATGTTCPDVAGATVNSITHAFSSLNAAMGGITPGAGVLLGTENLTGGSGYILNIPLYYDSGPDTTPVSIVINNSWTTNADAYINIYTPRNTSTEVNQSQRHSGVWSDTKYNLTVSDATALNILANYIRIDGLQLNVIYPSAGRSLITIDSGIAASNDIRISNNLLKGHNSGTYTESGITIGDSDVIARIWNNIVYDIPTFSNSANRAITTTGATNYIYNNTVHGGQTAIRNAGAGVAIVKNNIVQSASSDGYFGTFSALSDYNISDVVGDTAGISASYRSGLATVVTFLGVGDYHLDPTDVGAKDQGVVLKTSSHDVNLNFTTDIDNNTRPDSSWDIGADEYVVVDSMPPTLAEVSSVTTPTNDSTPNYTFSSTEVGTITYGGGCVSVTANAVSGNNTITFNALTIGTYGSCTITVTDSSNNASAPLLISSFTLYDDVAPTITNVSSDKTNGTYGEGEVVDIDVTFSEPVTSTGAVTVTLETGGTDRTCTFAITNSTTGTCNYTVQHGDTSSDLTVKTVSGTIKDQSGNPIIDFVPAINLASNKALVVDTADAVYYVNSATGNDSYSGTSAGLAWATIGKANTTLKAGDTVVISGGTYEEAINPTNSGYLGAYITYVAKSGETPIIRQVVLSNKQYIKVIGFEVTHNSILYNYPVLLNGASYIEILNNNIHHTYGQSGIRGSSGNTNYSVIRGNTVAWVNCPSGVVNRCVGGGGISLIGSYNLIEYNNISHATDFIITTGHYNIIRNNYAHSYTNADFPNGIGDVGHVDFWQGTGHNNTFENNFFSDNTELNSHGFIIQDYSAAGDGYHIIRGNVGIRLGSGAGGINASDYIKTYNNTFADLFYGFPTGSNTAWGYDDIAGDHSQNNHNFNNVYYKASKGSYGPINVEAGSSATISNNICEQSGTNANCDLTSGINFSNFAADDLSLQSSSSARNAGRAIDTVTSTTGSGTSFTVNDAGFFTDGTDIIDATGAEIYDTIKVGSNPAVKITSLNLNTDTITVGSSISWNKGDPVVLAHQNTTPDIGAYPYKTLYALSGRWSKTGDVVTVVPSDSSLVRFVIVYENGVPKGADDVSPYTVSGIGSGTITVKMYSQYASTNPVISATEQVAPVVTPTPNYAPSTGGGGGGGASSGSITQTNITSGSTTTISSLQNQIAQLTLQLNTLLSKTNNTTYTPYKFTRNLRLHSKGTEVKALQQYLNNHGFIISNKGGGSPGKETSVFGTLTYKALQRFQASVGLPPTGFFGPKTRGYVNGR